MIHLENVGWDSSRIDVIAKASAQNQSKMEKRLESEDQGVKNWTRIDKSLEKELSDNGRWSWKFSVTEDHRSQPLSGFQKDNMAMCFRNVKKAKAKKKGLEKVTGLVRVNSHPWKSFGGRFWRKMSDRS